MSDTPGIVDPGVYVVLDSGTIGHITIVTQSPGVFPFGIAFSKQTTDADLEDFKNKISALEPLVQGMGSERSMHVPIGKPRRAEC